MPDESINKPRVGRLKSTGAIVITHLCELCDRHGAFGYGVSFRLKHLGRWRCFEHRLKTDSRGQVIE